MHCRLWIKRPLAFSMIVTMLFSISASGCSSTQRVDTDYPDDSYREFEEKLADEKVRISLGNGRVPEGNNLQLNAATTTWNNEKTGNEMSIATSEVWRIQTTSGSKGAWRGFLAGFLILGSLGALAGASDDGFLGGAEVGGVAWGILGGLVGLVIGSFNPVTTTYEINPHLARSGSRR